MAATLTLPQLSAEQIQFYRENGYIQLKNFISLAEVERIKAAMYRAIDGLKRQQAEMAAAEPEAGKANSDYYSQVFEQRVNVWQYDAEMQGITHDPRFAEVARQLVGCPAMRLFHDHALIKHPGDNRATNWHQDTPYWPMNENGALSIWIALDDVDTENGCLQFIARSRDVKRLSPQVLGPDDPYGGLVEEVSDGASAEKRRVRDAFAAMKRGEHPDLLRIMAMPAGSVTFHDGLTLHYATANRGSRPRHALAIIFMPDGTTYSGASHCMTNDLNLTVGAPIAHERFPILARG
jgi:ectoine hydroxylase-related dioxygenase (phytanoyl-CoA dioxygenase family)